MRREGIRKELCLLHLFVSPLGTLHTVYDEGLPLTSLGVVSIRRASTVEPDHAGQWWADLSLVKGPKLGPYPLRSAALNAEREWLDQHWQPSL